MQGDRGRTSREREVDGEEMGGKWGTGMGKGGGVAPRLLGDRHP